MKRDKILLDVNIVMDLLLARKPFAQEAKILIIKAINEEHDIYVTNCSLVTLIYFMEKTVGYSATRSNINNLLQIIKGIDITTSDIQKAFSNKDITDTEDAIQMQGAIKSGMNFILTRDKNFLKVKNQIIPIISPKEYLNQISPQN